MTLDDIPPLPEREQDKPIRVYTCKACGLRGHNRRSCPDLTGRLATERTPRHVLPSQRPVRKGTI